MHIGKRIKEVLFEKGYSANWLSEQIPCERTNVYNIFRRSDMSIGLLTTISKILGHNFFLELADDYEQNEQVHP